MDTLGQFVGKQFIDVIQWTEPEDGILAYRFPFEDMEIQNGGQLIVRESQLALFVNQGRIADLLGPGLHSLTTGNLPLLTDLMNWHTGFESPFKSDVYFFSTRFQIDQRWGTATPITIRDKEFGAVRLRGYGIYSYHLADPRVFYARVSGTREIYRAADLEGQLRETIVARMADVFAPSEVSFLDMAANQKLLADKVAGQLRPGFAELGLALDSFVIGSISLPEELQRLLDQRIGMNMIGDMNRYTQFQVAQSIPVAAANEGGPGAEGAGLAAGLVMGQAMLGALKTDGASPAPPPSAKFCVDCGRPLPPGARFCPECGKPQAILSEGHSI